MKRIFIFSSLFFLLAVSTVRAQTSMDWFNKGYNENDFDKKIEYFSKAIELDPYYAKSYYNRGNAKKNLGMFQEAIMDYDEAIELAPYYSKAYNNRGVLKKNLGMPQEAILDFDKAIELAPNSAKVYNNRGNAKKDLGMTQEAIMDYDKAIELDPKLTKAYNNRGNAKKDLGMTEEANMDYGKAIKLEQGEETEVFGYEPYIPPTEGPNIWAVIVGVGQYQFNTHMSSLTSPAKRAYEIARVMEIRGFVDHEIPILTDIDANREAILNKLNNIFISPKVGTEDMIIFYFSGHGEAIDKQVGICPYDYFTAETLISFDEIEDILRKSPAKHKICVIEACQNEKEAKPMGRRPPKATIKAFNDKLKNTTGGLVYIASSELGEPSWEYPDIGGVFSYFFLEGIKGEADENRDKIITIKELFDYIKPNVMNRTNHEQEPTITTDGYRDIPFIILD
jgi:tetratricopeptide (TPR) repeat protein